MQLLLWGNRCNKTVLEVIWSSSRDPEHFNCCLGLVYALTFPHDTVFIVAAYVLCRWSSWAQADRWLLPLPSPSQRDSYLKLSMHMAEGRRQCCWAGRMAADTTRLSVISLAVFAWMVIWPAWGEGLQPVQQQNISHCSLPLCCSCDCYIALL